MGIRVKNNSVQRARVSLKNAARRKTAALDRVHLEAANVLADTAKEMTPFKLGRLEGSIDVTKQNRGSGKTYVVGAHAKHAIYMHEGVYDLGEGSVDKAARSRFPVGRKYLSRALDYLIDDWGLYRRAKAAIRKTK